MVGTEVAELTRNENIWKIYEQMLVEDKHENFKAFLHSMDYFFNGISLEGKSVLEIGSGKGLISIYMSLKGAKKVISMEPEFDGSRSGVIAIQTNRIDSLGLKNIELLPMDFNLWDSKGQKFDLIISRASINHLYESPYHALKHKETYQRYLEIITKMHHLLNTGGVIIVSDACRYGFFSQMKKFGLRRPWNMRKSKVNWRIHQNPIVWKKIFLESGFAMVDISYPLPYNLRMLKGVVNTSFVNFFLESSFILKAYV